MRDAQRNVVVVVLDTVRGRSTVPADGELLPNLASLAATGTEFRRAFASAPWTLPSHAGLLTGTYTSTHDTHGRNPVLDASLTTLPEVFSAAGYETRAISNNTWIGDEFGFDRGFDVFDHAWRGETTPTRPQAPSDDHEWRTQVSADLGAEETTDRAISWLGSSPEHPSFLFLNYIDAHFDYRPPEAYVADRLPPGYDYDDAVDVLDDPLAYSVGEVSLTEAETACLRALYRGELAYLDANVGRLVDALRATGQWDDTVLVVTSDHGENVGEHGFVGHQFDLYDTLLHVPLVVAGGAFDGGGAVDRLVQLQDLPVTLLDAAGIEAPAFRSQCRGRSFHPASTTTPREYVVAEYATPQPDLATLRRRYGDLPPAVDSLDERLPLRAVRTDRWKLVAGADGSRSLYDLAADPSETTDVADRRDGVADRLDGVLSEWCSATDPSLSEAETDVSDEAEERLRNLGYL